MAHVKMPLRRRNRSSSERPSTGSMLFPDLVWAHWEWQKEARPHDFPRSPRWARRLRATTGFLNGARPRGAKNAAAARPDPERLQRLKQAYDAEARRFEDAEGPIIRAYWCATEASAVVLTEKKKRFSWLPWRCVGGLQLHRVTDWVTADAPDIAELLHGGDMLAVRINRVLTAVPRLIAMEWVFSEQSYLLGLVERTRGYPSRDEIRSAKARHRDEIDRLERYYDRAARNVARLRYFGGMLLGLAAVAGVGALIPLAIAPFGGFDLGSTSARRFYACFAAGAVGAMVSVMTRMRQDRVQLDYEVGKLLIVLVGSFRPLLGAIFGVLAYFAIDSKLFPITPPAGATRFFYYAIFAFAAGFSERFAHVIVGRADLTLAKEATDAESPEPARPKAATPTPTTGVAAAGRDGQPLADRGAKPASAPRTTTRR